MLDRVREHPSLTLTLVLVPSPAVGVQSQELQLEARGSPQQGGLEKMKGRNQEVAVGGDGWAPWLRSWTISDHKGKGFLGHQNNLFEDQN